MVGAWFPEYDYPAWQSLAERKYGKYGKYGKSNGKHGMYGKSMAEFSRAQVWPNKVVAAEKEKCGRVPN